MAYSTFMVYLLKDDFNSRVLIFASFSTFSPKEREKDLTPKN